MRKKLNKVIVSLLLAGILSSGVVVQAKTYAKEVKPQQKICRMTIDPPSEPPMN